MDENKELERIRRAKLRELRVKAGQIQQKQTLDKPIKITDNSFAKLLQRHPFVVVDCWAPWCTPCHIIAPIIEEMALDYSEKIVFGKLNVDENRATALKYQIMSIPTLLVFKKGKLIDKIIGAMPRQMLEPRITRHL